MAADRPPARFDVIGFDNFPWLDPALPARVSREQALSVSSVLKGRNLIAGTIATLPIKTLNADLTTQRVPLFEQIDPDVPNSVTIAQTVEDLLFEGIAWWRVLARDYAGYPTSARHVDPRFVTWQMPAEFPLNRLPSGYYPGSHVFILSSLEAVPARDIKRFDSPNPALLTAASRTILRALKHEIAADMYADNPQAREYFTPAEDADPDDTDVDDDGNNENITDLIDAWEARRRGHSTGYVPAAFLLKTVDQMSPADLQMAELINKDTRDIANAMGLDPEDLGVSTTSRTYQNAVDRRQDRVNECYGHYTKAIEDRLSMGDITRRGQTVHFVFNDFLKANPIDRAQIHKVYVDIGAETDDEVRFDEGRPALTPAQRKALTPAPVAPAKPEHENLATAPAGSGLASVTPIGSRAAATHAGELAAAAATFAAEPTDRPGFYFDVSDVAGAFSVNTDKRTITGLVMPWNKVGRSKGRRWKFAPGSLQYDPSQANRLKLINDHDQSQILGRLNKTWSGPEGQWAEFKVRRGPAGDQALHDAQDLIKDGLSAGVGFEGEDHGITFGVDPDGDPDVLYVISAPWRETSHVGIPAFDDARVSAVNMSADPTQGASMKCSHCGQEHAPGIACPQAPATAPPVNVVIDTKPITDAINAGFAAMRPAEPMAGSLTQAEFDAKVEEVATAAFAKFAADNGVGPSNVNPVRPGDLNVNEKPLYRFDGKPGQRNFTADVASGFGGDDNLRKQAADFIAEQMGAQFANISVSGTTTLNPTINRQELYVGSLHFTRAIGSMVQGGVVDSITAQRLPKFSTSSGLAATHVEGTEPTDGAFTTTSQTITPQAISGRVTIDREVIDQGGTPQTDQLIWNEMTQFYAELLEKRLVAMFVALGLSDTPVIGTDANLQASLTSLFAGLQFVAGGDRYRGLALNQDLYAAATGANDLTGRPLYPMLNPTNASGTTAMDWSAVRIGSKVGVPAWALAGANSGPDKSFLFVPESCYQWFSPPRRIDLDRVAVATVGIGIWGYSAEFASRTGDVKQLGYTAG